MIHFLIALFCIGISACAQNKIASQQQLDIVSNAFNKQYSEIMRIYPQIKSEDDIEINSKKYHSGKIISANSEFQLLVDTSSEKIIEVLEVYKSDNIKDYDLSHSLSSYTPKCSSKSTELLYDLSTKKIALLKNKKLIFEGRSELINDRIKDDKNTKCLKKWGH